MSEVRAETWVVGERKTMYGRKLANVTVSPLSRFMIDVVDAPAVKLTAIHCIDNPHLTVTASIGVHMLWIKPVPLAKLVNLKECVAEDWRRYRAGEGQTALPEEVAAHLDILALWPGIFLRLYLHNTTDTPHRFLDGVLVGEILR